MDEIKDPIRRNFCENFRAWVERSWRGTMMELAKELNVSPQQITNILACRRCGDETWRRFVALKIGVPYHSMIGLIKETENKEIIAFTDLKTENLLKMTREVLTSDTGYAESLEMNIRMFHQAVTDHARLKKREKKESTMQKKEVAEK